MTGGCVRGNFGSHGDTVDERQMNVEDHDIRRVTVDPTQCVDPVAGLVNFESVERQRGAEQIAEVVIVLDDENLRASHRVTLDLGGRMEVASVRAPGLPNPNAAARRVPGLCHRSPERGMRRTRRRLPKVQECN